MFTKLALLQPSLALLLASSLLQAQQIDQKTMMEIGEENARMAQRAGIWDVTETVWDVPGVVPTTTKWVAERRMVGEFLEEVLEPTVAAPASKIQRTDYLSYHRIEGRWKYVSMDTRASVGLMPAATADRGDDAAIRLIFEPFAIPLAGSAAGQLLMMQEVIRRVDASHDAKDQYFNLADGSGRSSLGKLFAAYLRRAEESALGKVLVETTILHMATRQNPSQALHDAATVYKVDTAAIALKVKQEFAAKEKVQSGKKIAAKPQPKTVKRSKAA